MLRALPRLLGAAWPAQQHTAAEAAAAAVGASLWQLQLQLSSARAAGSGGSGGATTSGRASSSSSTSSSSSSRGLHTSSAAAHGEAGKADENTETIEVTFVSEKDGSEATVRAPLGANLLEVAHAHDVELEGACEASLACSTCHVVVEDEGLFHKIPEPTEDELDMLDLAFGLTETSRLGCQVIATKELDGLRVRIPAATRNFYVDGHVPKPH